MNLLIKDKKILERFYMDAQSWYALPIKCGRLLINVYVNKEYLDQNQKLLDLDKEDLRLMEEKSDILIEETINKTLFKYTSLINNEL